MSTIVKYDGTSLTPSPYVSRSYEAVDYGKRWGTIETYELRGTYTGNTGYSASIKSLADVFTGQFKRFEVLSSGVNVINEDYVVVDELSIENSQFLIGEPISYTARLKAYHVPSGVIEPSNEYSFESTNNGTVTVNHKVSAKGVRTKTNPLQNAIDFVKVFVGKNPYQYCNPLFIDNSSGILFSRAETIDRLNAEYSVTEVYRYNTGVGSSQDYVMTHAVDLNEGTSSDYNTVDFTAEYKGSTIDNNISGLRQSVNSKSFLKQIKDIYNFDTGTLLLNTFSISETSGENMISVRANYLSGASADLTGYFGYSISVDVDEILGLQTYSLNGEFISRGPINLRRQAVENFASSIGNDYANYTYGLITGSALYDNFKDVNHLLCPQSQNVSLNHNTGLGKLSLTASFDNRDCVDYSQNVDYEVKVEAAKPVYKLVPSANIEGHYVIQDLQCLSQERTTISVKGLHSGSAPKVQLESLRDDVCAVAFKSNKTESSKSLASGHLHLDISNGYFSDANIPLFVNFFKTYIGSYATRVGNDKFGY